MQVATRDFVRALDCVSMAIERRNTVPILGHVRVNGADDLQISGTNLDMRIDATIKGKSRSHESFMLPDPKAIRRAISVAGGNALSIDVKDQSLLKIGSGDLNLNTVSLPVDDWPDDVRQAEQQFQATLGEAAVKAMRRVAGAVSHEETRYYLNGIYLHKSSGAWGYRAVATDGHRLYLAELEIPDAKGNLDGVIFRHDALSAFFALADKAKGAPIRLSVGRRLVRNTGGDLAPGKDGVQIIRADMMLDDMPVSIASKAIDGSFPDYQRVIPANTPTLATFKIADLRRAMLALSAGCGKTPATSVEFKDGIARLSCRWMDLGDGRAEMSAPYEGKVSNFTVGFNGRYILGVLDVFAGCERITFAFGNPPCATDPVNVASPDSDTLRAVLMPMRV